MTYYYTTNVHYEEIESKQIVQEETIDKNHIICLKKESKKKKLSSSKKNYSVLRKGKITLQSKRLRARCVAGAIEPN